MLCREVVIAAVLSLLMVTIGFGIIIINEVVIASSLSAMGIIGVSIVIIISMGSLGLRVVLPVVRGMQHAGGFVHAGEPT